VLVRQGDLLRAYTAAEYADKGEDCPQVGAVYTDEKTGITYKFLLNGEGASAMVAGTVCVSKTSAHRNANTVVIGGQYEGANFAGARPYGADSLAAGCYGWFIIRGKMYVIASTATAATAVNCAASGAVEDFSASGARIPFGVAGDALTGAAGYVWANRNVWGQ
jgi:hypothetical protein